MYGVKWSNEVLKQGFNDIHVSYVSHLTFTPVTVTKPLCV